MSDHTYYLIMSQVFLSTSLSGESKGGSFFCFIVALVYAVTLSIRAGQND